MMNKKILERFKESIKFTQFNSIKLGIASPEQIKALSYGEVKKTETINYRTLKPEKDGLFCPRIFGPVQDWTCVCGKYKRMKHRGVVCEKCGVEVIESRVRRERMGHIELVAPVAHIWYLRGTPSYLGLILDITVKEIEKVVYFDSYIVVRKGKSPYNVKSVLSYNEIKQYKDKNPEDFEFYCETGAEGIKKVLEMIDLEMEVMMLEAELKKTTSLILKTRIMKRIKIILGLHQANIRPEWMIMDYIPVIAPDLRPLVQLEGGRFASSDLNELYRRVINRNIRLRRLMEIQAPSVIIKNEKRMLQESVDALIDNGRRAQPVKMNKRPLKSLSEMLRGKQGRFRQNLLGKRVDYSGRSVIVVDPTLKIDQFGIPKLMALELFKSHVICQLIKRDIASNIRIAKRIIEDMEPVVWDILEDIVKNYPVILNRAPTLHRLGIQAFYPTLVDTKAIKIHPLVTTAFGADFDGDQMGVYIPLSKNAIAEAKRLVISSANLLSSQNGRPVMVPSQEMVLGLYYLSRIRKNLKGEGFVFSSTKEALVAYENGNVDLQAIVKVRLSNSKIVETSIGRIILYTSLPEESNFDWVNKILNKNDVSKLVENVYFTFGSEKTVITLDKLKKIGFDYATKSGMSFSYGHLINPEGRDALIEKAEKEVSLVEKAYLNGQITSSERYGKILQIWDNTTFSVASNMMKNLQKIDNEAFENSDKSKKEFNFLYVALDSKSRGSTDQIKQLIGMRGLMSKPSGEIMETPVKSNFKSGLTVFEYFTSTHGARKGQADTALKTASAGYLTRRLVDVAQDVIITEYDCGTDEGLEFSDLIDGGEIVSNLANRIYGKIILEDIKDSIKNEIVLKKGSIVTRNDVEKLKDVNFSKILVRSVTKCVSKRGVCACCYGMDLSKNKLVEIGTAVGIIAAQSIGEPGTQLTMRTFHIGGTANLSEKSSHSAKEDGKITLEDVKTITNREGKEIVVNRKGILSVYTKDGRQVQKHNLEYGSILNVKNEEAVKKGDILFEWDSNSTFVISETSGKVEYVDLVQNITIQNRYDEATDKLTVYVLDQKSDKYQPSISINGKTSKNYFIPAGSIIVVEDGSEVQPGDVLVKISREALKTKDITGGLPRIAELFEARSSKEPCFIAEIDGEIEIGSLQRGLRKVKISNHEKTVEYLIPKSKQLNVNNGEFVRTGDFLTNGIPNLRDLLRVRGLDYVQYYLVNQIQLVYRSQGVTINDRHFELIVRQMTRKARIIDPGDTNFLMGDKIDRIKLLSINRALVEEGKRQAVYVPELTGITFASLGTESFISAASFQETTKILAEAAVFGQVDHLYGPKENVIIGRLVPAGTGVDTFKKNNIDNN